MVRLTVRTYDVWLGETSVFFMSTWSQIYYRTPHPLWSFYEDKLISGCIGDLVQGLILAGSKWLSSSPHLCSPLTLFYNSRRIPLRTTYQASILRSSPCHQFYAFVTLSHTELQVSGYTSDFCAYFFLYWTTFLTLFTWLTLSHPSELSNHLIGPSSLTFGTSRCPPLINHQLLAPATS